MNVRIADSEPIAIRVSVDAKLKTWHLPKKLLTTNSTFFAAALDGGFAEQDSKTVTLPEVGAEDFELWVQWLYLGELKYEEDDEPRLCDYKELVRLWSIGDMLGCPMFQNETVTCIVTAMSGHGTQSHGIQPELVAFIWDTCAPGSKLRKFAIDQCILDARMGRFKGASEEAHIQFAEDNEDFAKAYTAASIRNDVSERRTL